MLLLAGRNSGPSFMFVFLKWIFEQYTLIYSCSLSSLWLQILLYNFQTVGNGFG